MARTLFTNASILEPERGALVPDQAVLVEDERIVEVGDGVQIKTSDARHIDVRGRTLMPGLIDCHIHALAASADLFIADEWSPMYLAAHARGILEGMLQRGFTTVRDAAGADFGLARAVEEGLFAG